MGGGTVPSSTAKTVKELVAAASDLNAAAAKAEDALLAAFRRGEARAFSRIATLLSEAPPFNQTNLELRLAWYFENIPSYELATAQTTYFKGVSSYVENYTRIAELAEKVLAAGRVPSELTTMPEELIKALVNRDLKYFADLNAAALERLDQILLDQVVVGASPSNALASLRGTIEGSYKWGTRRGLYEWHAGTYARTAQMRFGRQVMKAKADQLELKHFVYVGPVDAKVRPFCAGIVGGAFSEAEIEDMDNGQTGDVMSDGGGYNCRHTWSPVDKSLFDELREAQVGDSNIVERELEKIA